MATFRFKFRPALIDSLARYDRHLLQRDLIAGVTVSVVALPLAMAFAIASGVKPEAGIFTAIIAGFIVSALGGSRVQIAGPAGAFIVVIYGIIEQYGLANLLIATSLAGVLLFLMGMLRIGSVIRYIPVPIVTGFTNGIAVLIGLSQLKEFFGLTINVMPSDFFEKLQALTRAAPTVDVATVLIAVPSLLFMFGWNKLTTVVTSNRAANRWRHLASALPASVVVLIISALAVWIFSMPVQTIGSRFGGIPQGLPQFVLPEFSWQLVKHLFAPTLTIALLGAIESLLCARIADNLINDRHNPNQELMAQGIANIVVPFFGGLPATGTIARTVTNIRSGAASPIAGMVHAFSLLVVIVIAAPLADNVPLGALAAILLYVAWNMGEWHEFVRLKQLSTSTRVLMLATFLLTVIVDLSTAVQVGLVLACVAFIYRISSLTSIEAIASDSLSHPLPAGVAAYSMFGSLFFGAVGKLESLIEPSGSEHKVLILELHQLISIDVTGIDALDSVRKTLERQGGQLLLCGANQQPLDQMKRTGFLLRLGERNCLHSLPAAIERASIFIHADTEPEADPNVKPNPAAVGL